jgi:hypothetical protein
MRTAALMAALAVSACASSQPSASGTGGGGNGQGGGASCTAPSNPSCPAIGDELGLGGGVQWSLELAARPPRVGPYYAVASFFVIGFDASGAVYATAFSEDSRPPSVAPACFRTLFEPLQQPNGAVDFRVEAPARLAPLPEPKGFDVAAVDSEGSLYGVIGSALAKVSPGGHSPWTEGGISLGPIGANTSVVASCAGPTPLAAAECFARASSDGSLLWHNIISKPANCGDCAESLINGVVVLPDGAVAVSGVSAQD